MNDKIIQNKEKIMKALSLLSKEEYLSIEMSVYFSEFVSYLQKVTEGISNGEFETYVNSKVAMIASSKAIHRQSVIFNCDNITNDFKYISTFRNEEVIINGLIFEMENLFSRNPKIDIEEIAETLKKIEIDFEEYFEVN